MNTYQVEIEVASDLYYAGRDEDGEQVVGESFYITATAASGKRFIYRHWGLASVTRRKATDDELDGGGPDVVFERDWDAREKADAEAARLRNIARLNDNDWDETRPAYGSDEYIRTGGDAELIEWERRIDEEEGWK